MSAALDQTVDIKKYFRMFWRRRALVVLCTVTAFCAALVGLEFVPETYNSAASLKIEERQPLANELEKLMGGMRQSTGGYGYEERQMAELVSRVRSQPFLERVVRLLRMNEDPLVLNQARAAQQAGTDIPLDQLAARIVAGRIRSQLDFEAAGSGIYRIIVTDSDPNNAQLLAKWISELFADVSVESALDELKRAHEFGAEQLKIYEEQLLRSERALEQYKQGQIEENLDRSVVRANNVGVAEALYRRVVDEVETARFRSLGFARSVTAAGQDRAKDALTADAQVQSQFTGLVAALKDAASNRLMGDRPEIGEWPPTGNYLTLRRGLFQLIERKAATAAPDQSTQVRDDLARLVFSTLDHQAHSRTAEFLGTAINDFKRQAQSEPRDEMELARLQADVTTNRELLNSFRAQLVASDVTQAAETTNLGLRIEILDPPQLPLAPSSPNRMMILIAALALGPILGMGVALASEVMDSTLRSLSDFERVFRGPVLGTTPLLTRVPDQQVRIRRYWVPATVGVIVLVTAAFFLTRENLLRDFVSVGQTVRAIDPKDSVTP